MTLHFRHGRGAALLRYINRDEITVFMCEQIEALSGVVSVPAQELSGIA